MSSNVYGNVFAFNGGDVYGNVFVFDVPTPEPDIASLCLSVEVRTRTALTAEINPATNARAEIVRCGNGC